MQSRQPKQSSDDGRGRFQFSLRSMFAALILSAVFLAALKEEWWSPAFHFAQAFAACLMLWDVLVGQTSRRWAAGLLAFALAYAAVNWGACYFFLTAWWKWKQAFPWLEPGGVLVMVAFYLWPVFYVGIGPLMVVAGLIALARRGRRLHWTGEAGLLLWLACRGLESCWCFLGVAGTGC
ncbi:MAG: hypothetical protein N2C14_10255 [Planctomycetales bacterium]